MWSLVFTGAWGQYVVDRDSKPVVSKRFNPELLARWWWRDRNEYFDIMYGHESNGQSIGSWATFLVKQQEIISNVNRDSGDVPDSARDYISRGWDYIGLTYKSGNFFDIPYLKKYGKGNFFHVQTLTVYVKFRYFLDHGFFQQGFEDFNPWEQYGPLCIEDDRTDWTPECYRFNRKYSRERYDGLTFIFKNETKYEGFFKGVKTALIYTTGYKDVFENHTVRLEHTVNFSNLPIMLWAQMGHNSDLVDYYKNVNSYGIALEMRH